MHVQENVLLSQHSTMRLGGPARYYCEVTNRQEVTEAVTWAIEHQAPPIMIGTGSNIIWQEDGFNGLIIVNKIMGYEDFAEDELNHYITIGGGENWDATVEKSVAAGLTGIEALSLVPGTTGATPVQNVGAYGQDISQTLVSVEVYDLHTRAFATIPNLDCNFGYRSSRFNTTDRGRFFITGVTLHLLKQNPAPPFYNAVEQYFKDNSITTYTPQSVRAAVMAIRQDKLPNPLKIANCGSFFGNPIVDAIVVKLLINDYPAMPYWPTDDPSKVKISAAWLIEQAGFKNHADPVTGMATWPTQSLVLVNERAKSTADLLAYKKLIVDAVQAKFNIILQQEPELLP